MIISIYIVMVLAAVLSGSLDALLIALDKRICHGFRLTVRALLAVAYIMFLGWLSYALQLRLALMALGAGALFTLVFRSWLNWLRDKPPAYISESNNYDTVWLRAAALLGLRPYHAGLLACICESALALTVAVIYTLL
jgi:hypothetical protein